jgi:hypothetical protein
MSEEQNLSGAEALKLVEQAQAPGVFDITEFAKGRAYPQDVVTAYLDVDSAYELNKLNTQINNALPGEDISGLESKAQELASKIIKSKIVFHMRGVNQSVIEDITNKCNKDYPSDTDAFGNETPNPDWVRVWTCSLVAANLIKVENANGEMDERAFTADDVDEFRKYLPKEIWDLITEKMQQLTLAGAYFKGLTDAGFLPKS